MTALVELLAEDKSDWFIGSKIACSIYIYICICHYSGRLSLYSLQDIDRSSGGVFNGVFHFFRLAVNENTKLYASGIHQVEVSYNVWQDWIELIYVDEHNARMTHTVWMTDDVHSLIYRLDVVNGK